MYQLDNIKKLPPLEYLRSFVVFVEISNAVKAATQLGISQPLLSLHLSRLEEHLGAKLFEFRGRQKRLNSVGEALYPILRDQLNQLSIGLKMGLIDHAQRQRLRIGARKEILEWISEELEFEGSLCLLPMTSEEIESRLRSRDIEIGISQKSMESHELIRKKFWSDQLLLFWSPALKVKTQESFKDHLAQLQKAPCYHYGDRSPLESLLRSQSISFQQMASLEFQDWGRLLSLAEKRGGWGIVPSSYTGGFSDKLQFRPLPAPWDEKSDFYLYYQKSLSRFPWARQVFEQILALRKK